MSKHIPHPTLEQFMVWRKEAEEVFKKRQDYGEIHPSLLLFASEYFGKGYMAAKAQEWKINHEVNEFSKELAQDLGN